MNYTDEENEENEPKLTTDALEEHSRIGQNERDTELEQMEKETTRFDMERYENDQKEKEKDNKWKIDKILERMNQTITSNPDTSEIIEKMLNNFTQGSRDDKKEGVCWNGRIFLSILYWKNFDEYIVMNEDNSLFLKFSSKMKKFECTIQRDEEFFNYLLDKYINIVQFILQVAIELNCDITTYRGPVNRKLYYIVPKGRFENLINNVNLNLTRGEKIKLKCLRLASEGIHKCKTQFGFGGKTRRKRQSRKIRKLRKSRRRR